MNEMTTHHAEDELVLHFYGERPDAEAAIDAHLQGCAACRETWDEMREALALVDAAIVPEPAAGFEDRIWARVRPELAAPRATWSRRQVLPVALWTAGIAATVALFVAGSGGSGGSGRSGEPGASVAPSTAGAAVAGGGPAQAARAREGVLLTALNDHFAQTELLLVELLNAPDGSLRDFEFERSTASALVSSGRLYRETAEQNGDAVLAQMLDDLEGVLVEVARSPQTIDRNDFNSLRTRIDNDDLLFKVRAVTNEVRDRQHTLTTTSMTESE